MKRRSVTIIPDNEVEHFTTSKCNCIECMRMHLAQKEWETFKPKNRLQKRMLDVVKRIEKRIEYTQKV